MYRTFNMGVGMVLVLPPDASIQALHVLLELLNIGYITKGEGVILK
jgi:phosphoribosylaminoimidazole (AIR) synthetase